ncbi:MAG: GlsB/YeaQ/YmgE family stress response membrane protein [Thermoanaerobaculia bacterium]|nr:GlsB/YeaQ/YmgE family stress response membrane protein [Thermoanaerobaculia bacterium]
MMIWLHGLLSWTLAGLVVGLLAWRLVPGRPALHGGIASAVGIFAAWIGGGVATYLGFGGLAAFDTRSLIVATLAAMVSLLLYRLASLDR